MKSQPSPKIEIGQLIDERPLRPIQILVMILSFLVVWLDGYHIQSMGAGSVKYFGGMVRKNDGFQAGAVFGADRHPVGKCDDCQPG